MTPASYTKGDIDRAGAKLALSANPYSERDAVQTVNYWRTIHRFPLKWLLGEIAVHVEEYGNVLVVGRIKKFDTIVDKLKRKGTPNKLKTMYDIAGCRIVVEDMATLRKVSDCLSRMPECDLGKSAKRDYIIQPKDDGYRGQHLIFSHDTPEFGGNLWIELQIRTKLQHAWATAVEVYDIAVPGSRLKFNEASNEAGDFFRNVSRLMALSEMEEPDADAKAETLCSTLRKSDSTNRIMKVLQESCNASYTIPLSAGLDFSEYCLVNFFYDLQLLTVESLPDELAVEAYLQEEEKAGGNSNLVLVKAASYEQLKEAYPNYFGNISRFREFVKEAVG